MPNAAVTTSFILPTLDPQHLPAVLLQMLCPSDRPLVLLPVRLETRFFPHPDGGHELRIRVYPDKVHLDAHETELTRAEHDWGVHFWEQDWRAGDDVHRRSAAWRQLADRYGAARAAWIIRVLRPVNSTDRPKTPVPPAAALPVAPLFSAVALSSDDDGASWRRAPHAVLLPDRWIAIVQSPLAPGAAPVTLLAATGGDIVAPLPVGPDPRVDDDENDDIPADRLAIDEGMKWMVDFDEAEARGMALRIRIPPEVLAAGIEALYVVGVASSLPPDEASTAMGRLLDAHHYTDGLDFLRLGAPSNNTAERRAGYSSEDLGHQRSFAAEVTFDPATLDAASNATRLGAALGLTPEQAATVLGRADPEARRVGAGPRLPPSHERDARAMNTALWQAGWGYYLSNMIGMDGTEMTGEDLAWARDYFVTHVRSAGPYPALRCGRQPYGVLPVTSLDGWTPGASGHPSGRDVWLRDLLVKLRDTVWRPHLPEAPRVGRRPSDPDADLADVMRLDGVSTGYRTRTLLGRHYLQHLRAFIGEDLQARGFIQAGDDLTGGILARLGFSWRPRIARATYADGWWRIAGPLVQAGEVSPSRTLDPDYIGALLGEATIDGLIAAVPDPAAPPLLQVLLRHALLREYAHAAALIAAEAPGADLARLLRDEELVDLVDGAPPVATWTKQFDLVVPAVTGDKTIRQFLEAQTTFDPPPVRALGDCRDGLAHLRKLDSDALQVQMQGTLDLCAHRLDAWITSFATRRLADMRRAAPRGLRVGGYGWVENLAPGPPPGAVVTPPPGEDDGPLVAPSGDTGFIHAPSLTHAATAALLRNAHLGHGDTPQPDGPFAIDLSSRRVREAAWLLDGMRQQQPIGALLGYRLERRLHELGVDRYIRPIRELAPLTAGKLENTSLPLEAIAANNVVDGDALYRMWRDPDGHARVILRLRKAIMAAQPPEPDDNATLHAIVLELDAIGEAIDAVSDALTAEAAYQVVRGNTARTAGTVKAIAEGDAAPPELEVARTPRTGIPITHRVVVLFDAQPGPTPGWAGADRPRAAAEPILNAWAARLLGDPRKVRCTVEQLGPSGEAVLPARTLLLSDLHIAPLDVVYGAGPTGDASDSGSALTEVEERVLYETRRAGGFGPDARLGLQHGRPDDLAADEITLLEVLEQARAVQALFAAARAVEPDDLVPPDQPNSGSVDVGELQTRTEATEEAFLTAHDAVRALVQPGADAEPEVLREKLLAVNAFGVERSVPATAAGDEQAATAALLRQAQAVFQESARRAKSVTELRDAVPARESRQQLVERMQAVFGSAFTTLPRFTNDDAAARDLDTALAANRTIQDGDPLAVHTWFIRAERVRDNLARLSAPLRGAEILGTGERLDPRVAQLPFTPGVAVEDERWVGLPLAEGKDPQAGKLSLVVHADQMLNTALPLAGLWVDEWVELLPSREETTGIAFQFNPPDACAPQSLLIAVPPDPAQPWTGAGLYRVLAETLDLAKLRAIDMESLAEVAHYLPALILAFNAGQPPDAVSTDLAPLTTSVAD